MIELLLSAFWASGADFTQAFRDMSELELDSWLTSQSWGLAKLSKIKKFKTFLEAYKKRLENENISEEERMARMQQINPRYVLRNWMAQKAIEKAEKEQDFSMVQLLLKILSNPYEKQAEAETEGFADPVPDWSKDLVVSCSS